MNNKQEADIKFLESQLKKIQRSYQVIEQLSPDDFNYDEDKLPETSDERERCARLADRNGFDGNVFRNLIPPSFDDGPDIWAMWKFYEKMIEMIPRIITTIEQEEPVDPGEYTPAKSPADWAEDFDLHWDTLKGQFDSGKVRTIKLSTKSYRVHKDDLPDEPPLESLSSV